MAFKKHIRIIHNPAAGGGRCKGLLDAAKEALGRRGMEHSVSVTEGTGHAHELAKEALGDCDAVAALGGDGTVSEIARALAFTDCPLALMHGGTGNDFSKALGYPREMEAVAEVISRGRVRTVDMARANGVGFVNVLGIGFDAMVTAEYIKTRRLKGLASYFYAFIKTLIRFKHHPVTIRHGGKTFESNALFLTIGNGPVCGGGFRLTPDAKPDDGLLDVTVLSDVPLPLLFWHLPKAFNGRIAEVSFARTFQASTLTVQSPEPLPSHIDGEVFAPYARSYTIEVVPKALKVLVP